MKKKRSIENQNIQGYMLRTYLAMACISVFIEVILCVYMIVSARSHMTEAHTNDLDRIVLQMDEAFANVMEQAGQLTRDAQVQQVLGFRGTPEYHGENILKVKNVMDDFEDKENYYEEIKSIFLVDKRQNIVVDSGKIYHEEKSQSYLAERGLEPTLFSSVRKIQEVVLHVTDSGTDGCRVYYIQGIFKRSYSRPDGYLVVELDEAFLSGQLALYGEVGKKACYLTLDDGKYIGADASGQQLTAKITEADSLSGTVSFQGERYVYSVRASDYLSINYCYAALYKIFKF